VEFGSLRRVEGVQDLRGAINSGQRSFGDFLEVLEEAEKFRSWLDDQAPTSDLVASYYAEATKKNPLNGGVVKKLRWWAPKAVGFMPPPPVPLGELIPPAAAVVMEGFDRFVLERLAKGWRPGVFVNEKLSPFAN
jgi:hypothetical protein